MSAVILTKLYNHNVPHSVSWKSKKKCNFVEVVWIASKTKIDLFWIHNLWGDCIIWKYVVALFFLFLRYYCVCPSSYRKIIWSKKISFESEDDIDMRWNDLLVCVL